MESRQKEKRRVLLLLTCLEVEPVLTGVENTILWSIYLSIEKREERHPPLHMSPMERERVYQDVSTHFLFRDRKLGVSITEMDE